VTQVRPFALRTEERIPVAATATDKEAFVSLAAQTARFLGAGHDRVVSAPSSTAAAAGARMTAVKEFHLATSERKKETLALTSDELAMQQAEAERLALKASLTAAPATATAAAAHPRPLESFRPPSALTQLAPFALSGLADAPRPRPKEDREALERAQVEAERAERRRKVLAAARSESGLTVPQEPKLAVLERVPVKAPELKPVAASSAATTAESAAPPALTVPAPFALSTESRGANKMDSFAQKLAEEAAAQAKAAQFVAAPMKDLANGPTLVPRVAHRKALVDRSLKQIAAS
jgi:hypothetical protein